MVESLERAEAQGLCIQPDGLRPRRKALNGNYTDFMAPC
jgi:hypothetical protein